MQEQAMGRLRVFWGLSFRPRNRPFIAAVPVGIALAIRLWGPQAGALLAILLAAPAIIVLTILLLPPAVWEEYVETAGQQDARRRRGNYRGAGDAPPWLLWLTAWGMVVCLADLVAAFVYFEKVLR
jgi:hypothetical protein